MISEKDILNGEPINGCIIVKVDTGQIKEDLGLSRDSLIELPEERKYALGSNRGEVIKMAKDAFGRKYQEAFGEDVNPPEIGDTIHFVPYQSARMDKEGKYYKIKDDQIDFIERK